MLAFCCSYMSGTSIEKSFDELFVNSTKIQIKNNITIITLHNSKDIGLIFYPGGKVEVKAYLPLLERISEEGITCYLEKIPFNLAVFNINVATKIIEDNININKWYL
ncbi:MAG: hypothetical protein JJE21_01130 [Spirochaetaceae bacterium]|nr:hypothetical protein [Spirochaetaceae bacterium]